MLSKILTRTKIDNIWRKVDLKKCNACYLIAIKEKETKKDTINVESVKKLRFELGIESGIEGKPITIQYINLDFNDITSGNNEINKITAFTRLTGLPNDFYIRLTAIDDGTKEFKTGETAISVNINALDLN